MAALYNKYHDKGFTILAVNAWDEDAETVKEFAAKNNLPYPILLKGNHITRRWGVGSIPTNFFIDREGEVVERTVG
ncbi:MAG: TlpA family protein disulfide reductase, partial [Planctomycetes bacterium]|nr:TlpA family protein disulfide reductase [Planctomycetota bacterium]